MDKMGQEWILHAAKFLRWLQGLDVGMSSKAIGMHMLGVLVNNKPWYPADSDDMGRCHRLLEQFPEWRARIGEMGRYPGWANAAAELGRANAD